jgi:hypothetical protein
MSKKNANGVHFVWTVLEASRLPKILNRSETKKNCHQNNCEFCFATLLVQIGFFLTCALQALSCYFIVGIVYRRRASTQALSLCKVWRWFLKNAF